MNQRTKYGSAKDAVIAVDPTAMTLKDLAAKSGIKLNSLRHAARRVGIAFKPTKPAPNASR
jgi:hypothetical protein